VAAVVGTVDYLVDSVAARVIGGDALRIAEAVRRRRVETSPDDRFVQRQLGLRLTQEQVQRGKVFTAGAADRIGENRLAEQFAKPEPLPTPAELDAPGLWIARLELSSAHIHGGWRWPAGSTTRWCSSRAGSGIGVSPIACGGGRDGGGADIDTAGLEGTAGRSRLMARARSGHRRPVRAACFSIVDDCVARHGRLDVLGNIAGIVRSGHFTDLSEADYRRQMAVNIDAYFFMSQAAMPHLVASSGALINIAPTPVCRASPTWWATAPRSGPSSA
jgi:hypothetical protein